MVLRLSDLVKKSIDKGYGSRTAVMEKPWTQGNLSLIDLKTESNPFIKKSKIRHLPPSNDNQREEKPELRVPDAVLNSSNNSLNPHQKGPSIQLPDKKNWWENINFSDAEESTQNMRLLVNYNLLCEEA